VGESQRALPCSFFSPFAAPVRVYSEVESLSVGVYVLVNACDVQVRSRASRECVRCWTQCEEAPRFGSGMAS
jgi:hypothetical protein